MTVTAPLLRSPTQKTAGQLTQPRPRPRTPPPPLRTSAPTCADPQESQQNRTVTATIGPD